ncbi:MAG TPA: hypothetical protein VN374_02000 [Desulfitobacteriaceae bacterium]|nr:hypothetical protein [Desulfitobacteriaceae bacterium]
MNKTIEAYCIECGEFTTFIFDDEDWICQNCGSFNSQGDPVDSVVDYSYDDA